MHDCTIVLIAMKSSCSNDFSYCASLHHPSFDEMIFALVYCFVCRMSWITIKDYSNNYGKTCKTTMSRAVPLCVQVNVCFSL